MKSLTTCINAYEVATTLRIFILTIYLMSYCNLLHVINNNNYFTNDIVNDITLTSVRRLYQQYYINAFKLMNQQLY